MIILIILSSYIYLNEKSTDKYMNKMITIQNSLILFLFGVKFNNTK